MKGSMQGGPWFQNSCCFSSSFCALIGMTLGWRGVMTKFAGFYDLPTAWSQVFWGIVLGGVYAVMADGLLFQPYFITVESGNSVYAGLNVFSLLLVALIASVFSHLLLRRARVRKGGSQPTSGWALGLAIGGMTAMVVMFRMFEFEGIFFGPRPGQHHAGVAGHPPCRGVDYGCHGHMMLQDRRWGPSFVPFSGAQHFSSGFTLRSSTPWCGCSSSRSSCWPIRTPKRGFGSRFQKRAGVVFAASGRNKHVERPPSLRSIRRNQRPLNRSKCLSTQCTPNHFS